MVDIRIPIGLMFTILGILISIFGVSTHSNAEMYSKSFGININIIMGVLMLLFGLIMLFFARRKKKE
jgi:sulfite exporter TauE/SafE